ncbi:MAG: hypothetical protein KatS3mg008_1350 [Acidimicrobiales bacterium]|nr:MAG: hypothetical protein KatS3mg008_1350 [Acidimicrobiales bacterium]
MSPGSSAKETPTPHAPVEVRIREALERISAAHGAFLQELATGAELSALQAQVLMILLTRPLVAPTTTALARECRVRTSTMSDAIAALAQKGLVTTERARHDMRIHTHRLTPDGLRKARKLRSQYARFDSALSVLSLSERESLLRLLLSTIGALWHGGIITVDRSCATCRFHRDSPGSPAGFCELLGETLTPLSLRTECPEHQAGEP